MTLEFNARASFVATLGSPHLEGFDGGFPADSATGRGVEVALQPSEIDFDAG